MPTVTSQRTLFLILAGIGLAACSPQTTPETAHPAAPAAETYVGRAACAGCHAEEDRLWQGSHHDLAMQTTQAVLGDFDGAALTHGGVTSTFFRRDGKPFVRTEGADGKLRDFPVAYAFGVSPLQQVLIETPGGKLQALGVAWDSRPAADGGQRWFPLYGDDPVPAGDPLHWTGANQRWNSMCAECHSTNLRKGYVSAEDRYETTWTEIDVSCESCHGPGSRHAADPRQKLATAKSQIDTCGPCHSRRSPLVESPVPGQPLLDGFLPALLEEPLYHADGQIDDEVFEAGSFLQSRMHREGVTCTSCHEPHSATLKKTGNDVCGQCHDPKRFDTPAHHRHEMDARGSACVDCHMPEKTYMGVDGRRDHSFRVPRPDLAVKLGTPDACTACHTERSPRWAADAVARWYGPDRRQEPHWGEALHAARTGEPGAAEELARVADDANAPAIARATALKHLRSHPGPETLPAVERGLGSSDPLLRLGAVAATEGLPIPELLRLAGPRLADPVRAVRVEAARVLSGAPLEAGAAALPGYGAALAEYRASQEVQADRPEARVNLGVLAAREGRLDEAEIAFSAALSLSPSYVPAYVDLADVYRARGRDAEGEDLLRRAVAIDPSHAGARHALGLLLIRTGRFPEALGELAEAVRLAPGEPRYAAVYVLAREEAARGRPR